MSTPISAHVRASASSSPHLDTLLNWLALLALLALGIVWGHGS